MGDIFKLEIDETDIHFTSIHTVGDLKTLVDPRAYQLMAFLTGNVIEKTDNPKYKFLSKPDDNAKLNAISTTYFHYVYEQYARDKKKDLSDFDFQTDKKYRNSTGIDILIELFKKVKFRISDESLNDSKLISELKNNGVFRQISGKYYYGMLQQPKKGWFTSLGLGGSSFVGLFEVTNPQEITDNNYSEIAKELEFVMTEAMAREYVEYKWNFFMPLDYKPPSMRGGGRNITRRKKHKKILRSKYRRRTKCTTRR